MDYNIRKPEITDVAEVFRLINQLKDEPLNYHFFYTRFSNNLMDEKVEYWLIEKNQIISGFISVHRNEVLHHDESIFEIQELIIDKNLRNNGLGSKLVSFIKERFVNIELSSNKLRLQSVKFYEKHGFKATHNKFTFQKNSFI